MKMLYRLQNYADNVPSAENPARQLITPISLVFVQSRRTLSKVQGELCASRLISKQEHSLFSEGHSPKGIV